MEIENATRTKFEKSPPGPPTQHNPWMDPAHGQHSYGRPPAIAGRRPLCSTAVVSIFFLFSPPNVRGRLADCR